MVRFLQQHKWKMAWGCYGLLLALFFIESYLFHTTEWFPLFLSFFGIIISVYPMILIFVQSRTESERANRDQIAHFQKLNQEEIVVMRELFQKQIDVIANNTKIQVEENQKLTGTQISALKEVTKTHIEASREMLLKQIDAISENTNKHISELQKSTDVQILALEKATQEQIKNYSTQTDKVIGELKNSSVLLGEIVMRQIEEAITETTQKFNQANVRLKDLKGWKLLRTEAEKQDQIARQNIVVTRIEQTLNSFKERYRLIKQFLGRR